MRKKTLKEMLKENNGTAYTDKKMEIPRNNSVKSMANEVFKKESVSSQNNIKGYNSQNFNRNTALETRRISTWDKVLNRAQSTLKSFQDLTDTALYSSEKMASGIINGITGIGQAQLTDLANDIKIGKKEGKEKSLEDFKKTLNPLGYVKSVSDDIVNNAINNKDKNAVQIALNSVNTGINNLPGIKQLKEGTQYIGSLLNEDASDKILKANENISKPSKKINEMLTKEGEKYGTVTQTIGNTFESVGNMIPSIAGTIATGNPTVGLGVMGYSAKGQATQEALKKGVDLQEAINIGNTKGSIEIATEMLTGGVNIFGKGALDDIVSKGIDKNVKNEVLKYLSSAGYGYGGEIVEETISDVLGTVIDKGTVDPNAKYSLKDFNDTAITTILSSLVLNSIGLNLNPTYSEINNKSNNINSVIESSNLSDVTKKSLQKVAEKYNLNTEEIKQLIDSQNQQTTIQNKEILQNSQPITLLQDKTQKNQFSEQIETGTQNVVELVEKNKQKLKNVLKKEKYINNKNAKNFFESAENNNLDVSNEKIEALFDLPNKRGIETKFDIEVFKDSQGNIRNNINSIYVTNREGKRTIIYNPNAINDTVIEKNAIHETFHDMAGTKEANEIIDFVYNRIEADTDFQNSFESLKETYANVKDSEGNILYNTESAEFENMIKEEAVADYLGKNLGNQEYINELANGKESRNIAQKIYDAIVKFLDKITGYKSEEAYLRGVKDKFEKAFNAEYQGNGIKNRLSIGGQIAKKNLINSNGNDINLEKMYNKALELANQKLDNEFIRQETHWFQDKTGNWKFEFSDKDMRLKKFLKKNSNYKLGDILEHNILFELYPELQDYIVVTKKLDNIKGIHRSNKRKIYINNKLLGSNRNIEKTLIHEIQHAIQNIEDFEGGGNAKGSKLAYYNKLGEIESSDVSKRFDEEKYQYKDISLNPPESSKINPKHKNLDNYLKNRGIIDKIKDKVYNATKEFFDNESREYDENLEENLLQNNEENSEDIFQINRETDRKVWRRLGNNRLGRFLNENKIKNSKKSSFSLSQNGKWKDFLEKTKINEGTTTTLGEIRLPVSNEIYNIKQDLKNFSKQVDSVIARTFPKQNMLTVLSNTPQVLQDIGLPNLPITMTQKHLDTIMNKIGKYKNANYHDLGIDTVKQLPEALSNPLDIVQSNSKDDSIVLTTYLADKQDRTIIASIRINGKGQINNIEIDTNVMTSAYGRNNYENFMEDNIKNDKVLYDIDRGIIKKLQRHGYNYQDTVASDVVDVSATSSNNIIPQDEDNMQENNINSTAKAQNYEKRKNTNFKRQMAEFLGVSQFSKNNKGIFENAISKIREEYNRNSKVSEETRNIIFNDMYNNLIKEDHNYYNTYKDLKNELENTELNITTNIKRDITDFKDFKREYFNNINISENNQGINVDSYYQELSSQYPELFPETITHPADQLRRIAEVSKSIRKSESNVSAYANKYLSKEYKSWAKNEFDKQVDKLIQEYKTVDTYNQDRANQNKKSEYIRPSTEEIRWVYENRAKLQKEYEKVNNKTLLTKREKAIVDRLLKDEMDFDEILPGFNKEAIAKVYTAKQQLDYVKNEVENYKKDVKNGLKEFAENLIEGSVNWKDKKHGLQYARETAQRNMLDIMSKEEAERLNGEIFDKILHNTSEQTRFINNYVQKVNELNIDKKNKYEWEDYNGKNIKINEADLAQLFIEKKIDENTLIEFGADAEKVKKIAKTFSEILEDTVNKMDDVYVSFGYAPVEKRKNYFPHFIENKPDTLMSKIANALKFDVNPDNLPTDIAGRTETFKPGRAFNKNILQRTTEKTDYNALKALDMYIQGASDIIYHTEDIQKVRALNEAIRDKYRDSKTQEKIEKIEENPVLSEEERQNQIQAIKDNQKTPLNNLVTWLDEYANSLANKKASGDRQMEKDIDRQMYTTMKNIEGRIASNLVGGNMSVALTNFAPLFQAMGTTNTGDILIGMIQTTQNYINSVHGRNDNFVYESDFLTSRRGSELTQKENLSSRISNTLSIPMEIADNFTSEAIVRAKYRENIKNGMEHNEALQKADQYARNLMADRSKGALPILFNRKNPVMKVITSFQVEPNNTFSNYTKDMVRDSKNSVQLAYQLAKLSVASYAFNTVLKAIRGGSDVIPNPIGIVSELIKLAIHNLDDDEENDEDTKKVLGNIANDILGSIPFGSSLASLGVAFGIDELEDNGRLMISSAMPDFTKVGKLFDSDISGEYKKQVIANELTKPLLYLGLPTGGAQLSKAVKGLSSYTKGGSYTYNEEGEKSLQFPIKKDLINATKSTIFGKYSTSEGKKYLEEFKGMNPKETAVYEKTNIDFYKLQNYFNYSKNSKKIGRIDYIKGMNLSTEQKYELYRYNILSSAVRDDGTSELTDAEYILNNKLANKEEYMQIYSKAEKEDVTLPKSDDLKELKKIHLNLEKYMEYKTDLKQANDKKKKEYQKQKKLPVSEEEYEESTKLKTAEMISLIQNEKYSDEEKKVIYSNYISKDDKNYNNLKLLTNDNVLIEDYLKYRQASLNDELSSDRKDDGTKKGKTIRGSAEKKLRNYLSSNTNFSELEKLYIIGVNNELDTNEKRKFENYINESHLTKEEKIKIYSKMKGITEYKDGSISW